MGLEFIFGYIEKRGRVIVTHPMLFAVVLVLGLLGGLAWRGQEVAVMAARIESYKEDVARYKDKSAAVPDPGVPTIQGLSPEELGQLKELLQNREPSYIEIFIPTGSIWAREVRETFEASGWMVGDYAPTTVSASTNSPMLLHWDNPEITETIVQAFSGAGIEFSLSEAAGGNQITLAAQPSSK